MKKKVKALVIATSVAAIAGIGAVSFAAWTGNHKTATSDGANGNVSMLGFSTNTATGFTGLLPYNQVDSAAPSIANNTMKTIALPTIVDDGKAFDITVKATNFSSALDSASALYVYVGTAEATSAFAGSETTEWLKIDADAGAVFANLTGSTARTAYFVLVSEETDDMNVTYDISFDIEAHN